jgi:hypothetical protein
MTAVIVAPAEGMVAWSQRGGQGSLRGWSRNQIILLNFGWVRRRKRSFALNLLRILWFDSAQAPNCNVQPRTRISSCLYYLFQIGRRNGTCVCSMYAGQCKGQYWGSFGGHRPPDGDTNSQRFMRTKLSTYGMQIQAVGSCKPPQIEFTCRKRADASHGRNESSV